MRVYLLIHDYSKTSVVMLMLARVVREWNSAAVYP